jgi:uncharacterized protein (TIGR02145 family)
MRNFLKVVVLLLSLNNLSAQQICPQYVKDKDGNTYQTVKIGTQCWMRSNLKVTKYQDGTQIPDMTGHYSWMGTSGRPASHEGGAFAIFEPYTRENELIYGKLYNYTAMNHWRGICPIGWNIPKYSDWTQLFSSMGGASVAGPKLMETGTTHWERESFPRQTNVSGFTALPGGYRYKEGGWVDLRKAAYFWYKAGLPIIIRNDGSISTFNSDDKSVYYGFYIRCILSPEAISSTTPVPVDSSILSKTCPATPTVKDIDGNIYYTVQIGSQCWMQSNLKVSKYRNGESIPKNMDTNNNEKIGSYISYNNNEKSDSVYGKLYNWYAVNDKRGLCPTGWHVPTIDEWGNLFYPPNGSRVHGGKVKEKGNNHWVASVRVDDIFTDVIVDSNKYNKDATNETGFTALPGGYWNPSGFKDLRKEANFWSSYDKLSEESYRFNLNVYNSNVERETYMKYFKLSIRCLRD